MYTLLIGRCSSSAESDGNEWVKGMGKEIDEANWQNPEHRNVVVHGPKVGYVLLFKLVVKENPNNYFNSSQIEEEAKPEEKKEERENEEDVNQPAGPNMKQNEQF